ncbi:MULTISPECIES: hypothetical protein [Bacillus cereus group]|uniref:hypothetical protein n=1 Tax=Bacillus cereus group TaxID=86661 RepID=UPI0024ACAC50|nr:MULTISPECIES: hypothetical protein [Bacillus cereus group]MDI6678829.1 hypothetical protein [Bacillus wiedmannii]MDM5254962.1 hypothetical protein [Bacillus toyonensis]
MDKPTFDQINNFCDGHNISQIERDFVIRKFSESFYNAVEKKETQKGSSLTSKEISDIREPLLNDVSLDNIIVAAKSYHSTVEERFFLQFQKNNGKSSFWNSVWVSIVANAIYSGVLIIGFILGKDLISGWLSSLLDK